jgi:phosphatidylinositol phospholipase C delta
MPIVPPSGKELSLHKLVTMSTMLSPTHHIHPLIQAGGGDASSEVPAHQLTVSHGIRDRIKGVYDNLRGPDHVLSHKKLIGWGESVQAQPLTGVDQETYNFEEFLALLFRNHGLEATRALKPEDKDLTKPISNYFISSSHNTYLMGNQLSSKSSTEAYKNVGRVSASFGHELIRTGLDSGMPMY